MSKLSIRFKIMSVLIVLVVALAGVGIMAVGAMRNINSHTVEIAENWLPSVRALGSLRADINEIRVVIRLHLMQEAAESKQAAEKRMAGLIDRVEKTRKQYEQLISTAEERSIYEQWSKGWKDYMSSVDEVLALSRKDTGRFPVEANQMLQTKTAKMAQAADPLLQKQIELNNQGAEGSTKQAADNYRTIFAVLAGIIVVSVLIAIVAAYLLVRDVSQGIASIIRPMQSLGNGDLSAEVTHRGEKTEIGAMADTLQIFKEALIAKRAADEAAAREAEVKIERGRRVDSITRNFEAMIGEIVDTVSAASTELEASASTLTGTATRGQELATVVASASEEASANVNSVASATEELSSSITEISRPGPGLGADGSGSRRPGAPDQRARQRTVAGGSPHRRRCRTHQHHCRPDQPAGAQCDDRGRARRRGGPRFRCRGAGGQGAGRADRKGHRRDRTAGVRHPVGDP
jgi:methyl-accepting chemotaxis protein